MRKTITLLILLCIVASEYVPTTPLTERDSYKQFLQQHKFNQRKRLSPQELKQIPKEDRPDLAWEQNYLSTLDPALGRPAPERLLPVYQQVASLRQAPLAPGSAASPWVERGPTNVGGRTRALMWDPNAASGNKVWAGGVTGGLWYNNDITSNTSQWIAVNDFWDNISITAIAYDPNNTQIFYVATGEGWGAGAARGEGIWKSTDGGSTWNQLSSTSSFYYINDLVVRNESGSSVVYAACRGNFYRGSWHGSATNGLQRSTNGGSSWSQVLPNVPGQSIKFAAADIEIAADNRLWVGTTTSSYGASDRGGGRVLYSDNGTSWTIAHTVTNGERVELACAPSNTNYVYALTEIGNQVGEIAKTTNNGSTWTSVTEPADADNGIPNTDFSRGQAWYDLIIAVDPNNPNTVVTGGIDLFRTIDGGTSWSQISKWSNNNNLFNLNCALVHADQHQILFKPGNSNTAIFGNDGGVYYTNNLSSAATSSVINARNNGYNVTQFYAAAIHPTAGQNYYLAGSQDNGTQKFSNVGLNATTRATGGDGAWCFIDQDNPTYQVTSYVYNNYWRSINGGVSWGSRIQNDGTTGKFINPADYDDVQNTLYSSRTSTTINRINNLTGSYTIDNFTVSGMSSMASHLRVSPYTTTSTTLFVGTDGGDLFKITNANGSSPSSTNIGSSSFPNGSISCVELGASESEILVTFSNYGVTSVWYTSNGGSSWTSKEGNLPDMPVRWALFNPNNRSEAILATEVGVWSTSDFTSGSPSWTASNSGLANVRVDMLQIRQSDKQVIAATHGRGLFSSDAFGAAIAPTANFGISASRACLNQTISLFDSTIGNPTAWAWTITPNTYTYVNGTTSSSQNPEVQFTASGSYTISLTATNANGSDVNTVSNALFAGGLALPFTEDFEGATDFTVSNPDNQTTWALGTIGGTTPGNQAAGIDLVNYSSTGQRDGLISPSLDFTGYSSISLSFDYAYRRYSSTYRDSMAVYVSTDCGNTYTRVASYKSDASNNFATGPDQTSAFTPSVASDWCGNTTIPNCPSIDLSAFAGQAEVKVKIEAINGYGNNLWVDNINVSGTTSALPVTDFSASDSTICAGSSVIFTDLSTNIPNSWTWSISPTTFNFINGTSASSQNPEVQFSAAGSYQVSLTSTNASGSDSEVKTAFITVNSVQTPTVSISASNSTICSGTSVTFTAVASNEGASPTYQWKVNGTNAGNNSNTFTSSTLNNNDVVMVELSSSLSCISSAVVNSNNVTMNVTPSATPTVSATATKTSICTGEMVMFTAAATNAGTNPTYQWKVNGTNAGTNSNVFSSSALQNNDVVTVDLTSTALCASPTSVTSTGITMQVSPSITPTAVINASATTICQGNMVTFTANTNNGGTNPSYQWTVNGVNVGTNSSTYSSNSLNQSDVVSLTFTSNASCVNTATVSSNSITMTVNSLSTPTVSISTRDTTVCAGSRVSFTASVNAGNGFPWFNWRVNGTLVSNSLNFSTTSLQNHDTVVLEIISFDSCYVNTPVMSNSYVIEVLPIPVVTITTPMPTNPLCLNDTLLLQATYNSFGRMAINGPWSGNGVQGNKFIASLAGPGTHAIAHGYIYLDPPSCATFDTLLVTVDNIVKPTVSQSGNVLTCNQSGFNYQWFLNGTPAPGTNNQQSYTTSSNGQYLVEISTTNCSAISDVVSVNIGLSEYKMLYSFEVFPNPAKEYVNVRFTNPGAQQATFELYSFNGSKVLTKTVSIGDLVEQKLNVSALAKGIYTLKVQSGNVWFIEKFERF